MTPEEELRRSERARQLLEDPLLSDTLNIMEKEVHEAWLNCPIRDTEGKEYYWRLAVTARKFRDMLQGTMESGKLASQRIKEKNIFEKALEVVRR